MSGSGVLMRASSCVHRSRPSAIRLAQSTPTAMNTVDTAVRRSAYFFAPKRREMMMEQPTLLPMAKAMKISVISYALPTAASAFSPIHRPATRLSAML